MRPDALIRPVGPADRLALARLWHDAWHETQGPHVPAGAAVARPPADFARRLAGFGDAVRLAEGRLGLLGLCAIAGDELDQLFVAPAARGTGVAAALLADGEARLSRSGVRVAQLKCLIANARARAFYARHGWRETGEAVVPLPTSAGDFPMRCALFAKQLSPRHSPA